jgi:formylglycine-generating enzyme required for sulfatase activity
VTTLTLDLGGRQRVFTTDAFPLSLGGPQPHVPLSGSAHEGPVAYLGQDRGAIFIQPAVSSPAPPAVSCNGVPLTVSRWLDDGDQITVGQARLRFSVVPGGFRLAVESAVGDSLSPPAGDRGERFQPAVERAPIRPAAFTPQWQSPAPRRAVRLRPRSLLLAALFAFLAGCAWYVLTAYSVAMETDPPADRLAVTGGVAPGLRGRYLLRPGTYRLRAERAGYLPIDAAFDVGPGAPTTLQFSFEPLGGLISIRSRPVNGATVVIDGKEVGATPIDDLPLAAGDHTAEVAAPRHLAQSISFRIEPGDPPRTLEADLEPNWAPVAVASSPSGAEVRIDGAAVGATPSTFEVEAGSRTLEIRKAAYKPARRSLEIVAGEAVDLGVVTLTPEDGRLSVTSRPAGATVTVGSEYRGTTPLELAVPPGAPLEVRVSLAGHATYSTEVAVAAGQRVEVQAPLEALTGEVLITSQPQGAELLIDGSPHGRTGQTVELEARPHEIEVRLEGYGPYRTTITPEPGLTRAVRAILQPAGPEALARSITSPQGVELVLVDPGKFIMGASRREPGRRANEVLREVEITRPYYLAVREVTNREFREFQSGHLSGAYGGHNLEIDHHPVVNVTWEDAARYCNWLSEKAGLPPVYVERSGALVPRSPLPMGYRLPTEAEWAWAARYAGSSSPSKYPWGDSLPVPPGAGNFGDASAEGILHAALPDYRDGYPVTAPAGSFGANGLGLYNLGGNVAEWVQDVYTFTPSTPGVVERDPTGPASGAQHVVRGASWMDTTVTELRLTSRDGEDQPRPDLGFRIARSAE